MDEENKPGALEKATAAIRKTRQLKKTIEVLKNAKILGPIIGAILPVIGWILLVLVIILAIIAAIILVIAFAKPIIEFGDKNLNWLSGYGYLPSDTVYYDKLNKAYEDFHDFNNPEGEFDIAMIQATTFYNRMVDPSLKLGEDENADDVDDPDLMDKEYENEEEEAEVKKTSVVNGAFKPIIDEINYVDFYRLATNNVGNVGAGSKLAGHLVDIKLTAGRICYDKPDDVLEGATQIVDHIVGLVTGDSEMAELIQDFSDALSQYIMGSIEEFNPLRVAGIIMAKMSEGFWEKGVGEVSLGQLFKNVGGAFEGVGDWGKELLTELRYEIKDENVIEDIIRIISNSDFSNSDCTKDQYYIPRITHYVNYERYKKYLKQVYLPNQPYAECEKCDYKNAKTDEEREKILNKWVQDIQNLRDLYVSSAPSLTEEKDMLSFTCPNGITVKDKDGNIVISNLDLEEYVKGVVAAENSGAPLESMKAQAVAARTFALFTTNFCDSAIVSSSNAQNYKSKPEGGYSEDIENSVEDTRGQVLLNAKDIVFRSEYDAFCALEDCNNSDTCFAQYQRLPSSGFQTFSMPSKYINESEYKNICDDVLVNKGECELEENKGKCDSLQGDGGHGRGMSQEYANYLATNEGGNHDYEYILLFFYGDGVHIGNVGLFYAGLSNIEETPEIDFFPNTKDDYNRCGSDIFTYFRDNKTNLDNQLKNYVKRDYGTRNGPVMAAYFLSGETRLQGYVLPYFFSGGHGSFPITGVNSNWGSTCSAMPANTDKQPKGQSFNFGLDCSSFVSWALYNGGFNQNTVNANTLAYLGSGPITWNEGSKSAQAGDLVVTWYNKSNDFGHVGIVISVDESYIWVAHEAGASRGLIIQKYSKVSFGTGFSHIVLMDSYYNNEANKR